MAPLGTPGFPKLLCCPPESLLQPEFPGLFLLTPGFTSPGFARRAQHRSGFKAGMVTETFSVHEVPALLLKHQVIFFLPSAFVLCHLTLDFSLVLSWQGHPIPFALGGFSHPASSSQIRRMQKTPKTLKIKSRKVAHSCYQSPTLSTSRAILVQDGWF